VVGWLRWLVVLVAQINPRGMDFLCVNYETSFFFTLFFVFGTFFISVGFLFAMTYDYYHQQVRMLCLQEKMEELDLELGLLRGQPSFVDKTKIK